MRRERRKEQQGTGLGFQQVPLRVIGSGCIDPGVIRTLLHRGGGEKLQGDENNKDGKSGGGSFPVPSVALDESKITHPKFLADPS